MKGGGGGLNDEGGHLVRNFKGRWWDRHLERQRDTKGQRSDVADCLLKVSDITRRMFLIGC